MNIPTRKGMDTKDRMIAAAITLMRRSGLSGAGINEIVRESGAPKGSIYHFFPEGKRQVATEALGAYSQRILAIFEQALGGAGTPGGKVRALFRVLSQRLEAGDYRSSCAAGAVCLDLDEDFEIVREAIEAAFADWTALIARHFQLTHPRRAASFAGLVLTTIQGGYIRGRAERSTKPFAEAAEWLAEIAERESSGPPAPSKALRRR